MKPLHKSLWFATAGFFFGAWLMITAFVATGAGHGKFVTIPIALGFSPLYFSCVWFAAIGYMMGRIPTRRTASILIAMVAIYYGCVLGILHDAQITSLAAARADMFTWDSFDLTLYFSTIITAHALVWWRIVRGFTSH